MIRIIITWTTTLFLSFFFATVIVILFPFVYLFDRERHSLHALANLWAKVVVILNPWWKFKVYGRKNLAKKGEAVIYVSNHESQADILAIYLISTRFRWLGKSSIFKIPFLGWGMKAVGYVPVVRGNKASGEKCLAESAKHLKAGTPMVFFPEGTRSKTGKLGDFKSGAFRLAKNLNIPIVPISIEGCAELLPKGSISPQKAKVIIKIHPRILPEDLSVNELMLKSKQVIASDLEQK